MHSYHIFYFPFRWENPKWQSKLFEEQTNIDAIPINTNTNWAHILGALNQDEEQDLYNEKNFFHKFVHPVLYDTGEKGTLLKHFERKEPQQRDVFYSISQRNGKTYTLKVDAINLNLYVTGIGMLTFFLINERDDQKSKEDILFINQYGRRIYPPFFDDIKGKLETAEYLKIEGLNGNPSLYYEDFSSYTHEKTWTPASFIFNLISDLSEEFTITPVIDDRMFVNCWYENDELSYKLATDDDNLELFFLDDYLHAENKTDDYWYKYVYVDAKDATCKNDGMKLDLLNKQTCKRWQKDGMLYGASRYSFVFLTKVNLFQKNVLAKHMRTIYSRIVELILIQRASVLRFSDEITNVSRLSKGKAIDPAINKQITSLYKEYIRFLNQIHFREVTIQDQGIELYQLIYKTLNVEDYVEDLEREIKELYQYVSMMEDKVRNRNAEILNIIAAVFLPATLFATLFGGMEGLKCLSTYAQVIILFGVSSLMYGLLKIIKQKK